MEPDVEVLPAGLTRGRFSFCREKLQATSDGRMRENGWWENMTVADALQSAQFVVDKEGQRTAVILDIRSWEMLIGWIEDITDTKIASQALTELHEAGGRSRQAGWLAWDDIREEWGDEEAGEVEDASV